MKVGKNPIWDDQYTIGYSVCKRWKYQIDNEFMCRKTIYSKKFMFGSEQPEITHDLYNLNVSKSNAPDKCVPSLKIRTKIFVWTLKQHSILHESVQSEIENKNGGFTKHECLRL